MWHPRELKDEYDVVIIGGGVHGLATAYIGGVQIQDTIYEDLGLAKG